MRIPPSELLSQIHPDAVSVCVRDTDGRPIREFSLEELGVLTTSGFVVGVATARGKLREIWLVVPTEVALRAIREVSSRIKRLFRSAANETTVRSLPTLPRHIKQHHMAHCLSFGEKCGRHLAPIGGEFTPNPRALTLRELAALRKERHVSIANLIPIARSAQPAIA